MPGSSLARFLVLKRLVAALRRARVVGFAGVVGFASVVAFVAALAVPSLAWAAPEFPALTGRVVDDAHLLSPEVKARIDGALEAYERVSTNQLVVVTLPDLQGYPIEEYGYQLGRH